MQFRKIKFSSLFKKNSDGSFSPQLTLSIMGIAGHFTKTDKISDLRLIDGSVFLDHKGKPATIGRLNKVPIIMNFSS